MRTEYQRSTLPFNETKGLKWGGLAGLDPFEAKSSNKTTMRSLSI